MTALVLGIVAVPALAAVLGLLTTRMDRLVAIGIAVLAMLATVGLALAGLAARGSAAQVVHTLPALDAGELKIPLLLQASGPTLLIALVVAVVGLAVQVFSAWYLADDDRYAVFAATVSVFCAAMLLVVLSADLVLTLVGWEVMGWCSYLLIGHWSRRASARRAAHKAFIVTRVADVGFVLGVVILAAGAQSTAYDGVIRYWTGDYGWFGTAPPAADHRLLTLALVLLVIGVLGKSAQFPFQDWLPDAMEGPTPASALIHAATMVAAGTFVLAQLFPLLVLSGPARAVLAVSTAVTMVGSAVTAFGQSDLKRLLAWSTVSQVAVMLSALAAAPVAEGSGPGVLHLYAHAFFKALLFLAIGWMSILVGGTSAVALTGVGKRNELLRLAFLVGLLSLAGLPFVVGGVSKEHVVSAALAGARDGDIAATIVFVALLITIVLTAAYATRAYLVIAGTVTPGTAGHGVSLGEGTPIAVATPGEAGHHGDHPAVAAGPPLAVVVLLGVLLGGTVFGGLILLTDLLPIRGGVSLPMLALTLGLAVVGALGAWRASVTRDPVRTSKEIRVDPAVRLLGGRMSLFDNGFGVDRVYRAVVAAPVMALAGLVARLDTSVVDATGRGAARGVRWLGRTGTDRHEAERPATGLVWVTGAAVVLGAVGVLAWR